MNFSWNALGFAVARGQGCGYPPQVDCATFHRSVASHLGTVLPCYTNQRPSPDQRPGAITMAIFRNDPQMDWWVIQAGLVAPLTVFGVSVLLLCCWHNRTCHRLWRWAAGRCWRRRDVAYRCPASDSSLKSVSLQYFGPVLWFMTHP